MVAIILLWTIIGGIAVCFTEEAGRSLGTFKEAYQNLDDILNKELGGYADWVHILYQILVTPMLLLILVIYTVSEFIYNLAKKD